MRQSLLFIILFLSSCITPHSDKQRVDRDDVDYINIRKQFDTVALRLTPSQTSNFIRDWNSSKAKELYKFLPDYFLTIHLKGDSTISYRTSGELIKQKNDFSYSVGDKSYFKNIWLDRAGLTNDYTEYYPAYFRHDKFTIDTNPLDERQLNTIKQVLTYYTNFK